MAVAVVTAFCAGVGTAAAATSARTAGAGTRAGPAAANTPASTTGNVLVMLDRHRATASATATVHAAVARVGGRPAGRSVPEIGLITVRPRAGQSAATLAHSLSRPPGV